MTLPSINNVFKNHFSTVKYFMTLSLCLVFMLSCKQASTDVPEEDVPTTSASKVSLTEAQQRHAKISTAVLSTMSLKQKINLNGTVEVSPQHTVSVSAPLGGYVNSTKWMAGMQVQKGQVLAVVEDISFVQMQEDYLMAKSGLYFAEKEYNRQKELNKTQASSEKAVLQAEEAMISQQIALTSLIQKLRLIHIDPSNISQDNISRQVSLYAPISGVIAEANINIGKNVQPTDVMFKILDTNQPMVVLKAFGKDIPYLSVGNPIVFSTNASSTTKFMGKIVHVGADIKAGGYVEVICSIEKPQKSLLPNMYVVAEIESSNVVTLAVKESALVGFEDKEFVFIKASDGSYTMTEVSTGWQENGFKQLINADALQGKEVVVEGAYTLLMKMKNVEE